MKWRAGSPIKLQVLLSLCLCPRSKPLGSYRVSRGARFQDGRPAPPRRAGHVKQNIYRLAETPRGRQLYEDFFFNKSETGSPFASIGDENAWKAAGLDKFLEGINRFVGQVPINEDGDFMEWWLRYLMSLRTRRYTVEAMKEMVSTGFALSPGDPAYKALEKMVVHPGGRKMTQAVMGLGSIAETRAVEYLRKMGLDDYMLTSKGVIPYDLQTMWTQARDGVGMMGNIASEYRADARVRPTRSPIN